MVIDAKNSSFQVRPPHHDKIYITSSRVVTREGKPILLGFDGADMSSNAGLTLLREIERRNGLAGLLASCLEDLRDPSKVQHGLAEIIRFRIMMIAAGVDSGRGQDDTLRLSPLSFAPLSSPVAAFVVAMSVVRPFGVCEGGKI